MLTSPRASLHPLLPQYKLDRLGLEPAERKPHHLLPGLFAPLSRSLFERERLGARIVLEQVRRVCRCNTGHVDLQADAGMATIGFVESQHDRAWAVRRVEVPALDGLQEDAVVSAEHHERWVCHCRRYRAAVGMAAHCRGLSHSFRHSPVRWKRLAYREVEN